MAPRSGTASPRRSKSTVLLAGIVISGLTIIAWSQNWFTIALTGGSAGGGAGSGAATDSVQVGGDVAGGGLAALGLAGLALVGVLSIAGPAFRVVLGVLEVLIGVTVALSSSLSIADPAGAAAPSITDATGVSGADSVRALAGASTATPWPFIAVVLGIATVAVGILILVSGRNWPGSSRKYQAVRMIPAGLDPAGLDPDTSMTDSGTTDAGITDSNATDSGITAVAGPATAADATVRSQNGPNDDPEAPARRSDAVADWDALSDGADPTSTDR